MTKAAYVAIILMLAAIPILISTSMDINIIRALQILPSEIGRICLPITEAGKSEYYLVFSLVFAIYYLYRGRKARMLCKRAKHFQRAAIAGYVFAAIALSGIIVDIIKPIVGRARPKEFLQTGMDGFDPFTLASRWQSFPSGHTNTMVALVIALVPFIPACWRPALTVYAAIIISSRAIVAAHYVSDMMGGAILAAITCLLLERYVRGKYRLPFGGR